MRQDRPRPILKIQAKCHLLLEERDITGKTCLEQHELFTIYNHRVNYDTAWWREIAEILRTDKSQIPPINRAQVNFHLQTSHSLTSVSIPQIICDILALEELGYVSHSVRKDVLSYISSETDFGALLAHQQCSDMRAGKFQPRKRKSFKGRNTL